MARKYDRRRVGEIVARVRELELMDLVIQQIPTTLQYFLIAALAFDTQYVV